MIQLSVWDWTAIVVYLVLSLGIGLVFTRRGSRSLADFFCSGRSAPWWLLGVSMVATTFAADTPLAVTGFVAKDGITGNWIWWNFLMSGMLTTFLFARLWRRSEVLTDVELTELRYAGMPARGLRVFRALYLAFPINCVVMGWVTVGMFKVVSVTMGCTDQQAWYIIYGLYAVTCLYVMLSGLWGVLATDFVQFGVAMAGSIVLAIYSLDKVGGVAGLQEKLIAQHGIEGGQAFLRMIPRFDAAGIGCLALNTFLVMICVQWWAAWYPGAEPGGGGYIAQRMFSAKNERHALLAALFFNMAHYALRPWPWIIVGLCSIVVYPGLTNDAGVLDPERGYPKMMVDLLSGTGLLGLLLVAFLAAFMSTIATQVNWGASYVVNDVYKRFIAPAASERHYVLISRLVTVVTIVLGIVVSRQFATIKQAWEFILAMGAGTGLVLILRWYWWRINAWSEITAMAVSLIIASTLQIYRPGSFGFANTMLIVVADTTIVWLTVTFLTRPEPWPTLIAFYRKVRPGGPGWAPVRERAPEVRADRGLGTDILCVIVGVVMVYAALFGTGEFILGSRTAGLELLALAVVCFVVLVRLLRGRSAESASADLGYGKEQS